MIAAASIEKERRVSAWWLATFLAYPPAGLIAVETIGSIDGVISALAAGALAGAVIGLAQWLVLRVSRITPAWIWRTALGVGIGAAAGALVTDAGTAPGQLAVTGALTGLALGLAQARSMHGRLRQLWPALLTVAWALGWLATWAIGVDVERGYAVPGASGALLIALLSYAGLLLVPWSEDRL